MLPKTIAVTKRTHTQTFRNLSRALADPRWEGCDWIDPGQDKWVKVKGMKVDFPLSWFHKLKPNGQHQVGSVWDSWFPEEVCGPPRSSCFRLPTCQKQSMGITLVSDGSRAFDTTEGRPFRIRNYFGCPLMVTPYLPFLGSLGLIAGHGGTHL